jgi:transglutaminase-like putative cysteine protease
LAEAFYFGSRESPPETGDDMKKVYLRVLILFIAGLLLGSSAFATQQFLPQRAFEPTAEVSGGLADADSPDSQVAGSERDEDNLPVARAQTASVQDQSEDKPEAADITPTPTVEANVPQIAPLVTVQAAAVQSSLPVTTVAVVENKSPASPYSLKSSRNFTFLTKVNVKNTGDATATGIRLQVPLLSASSLYQVQQSETFSVNPSEIQNIQGTRVGVFNMGDLEPGAELVLELRYNITTSIIEFFGNYIPTPGSLPGGYLQASNGIESDNAAIINLSTRLTQDIDTDWEMANAITRWVAGNIKYDGASASRNGGALQALQTNSGVCEDFATLSAALARAAGIPARVVYGYADTGTRWPQTGSFALRGFRHAWVEYYLQGRGWVPAEPTRSRSNLYFGTLPHNRYIAQNYHDISLKANYRGGKLAISWTDSLE